ncbi:hypothetical protein DUI87_08844 [Hirundo rustica rustica]|uniref:Uncharacterized protein n=1 Tax=Hirundo rustica rustica TaxID=333673 RepID=A0A3M0KKI5_HIRRU|nr:hypothetical protein DUI87_08844 [Hirundo rustica rustica]
MVNWTHTMYRSWVELRTIYWEQQLDEKMYNNNTDDRRSEKEANDSHGNSLTTAMPDPFPLPHYPDLDKSPSPHPWKMKRAGVVQSLGPSRASSWLLQKLTMCRPEPEQRNRQQYMLFLRNRDAS